MSAAISRGDIKYAKISISATGDIVAAVTGFKIIVTSYVIVGGGTATAKWTSKETPTDLTGAMPLVVNSVLSVPYQEVGHFATNASETLTLTLGASVAMAGHVTYILVPA